MPPTDINLDNNNSVSNTSDIYSLKDNLKKTGETISQINSLTSEVNNSIPTLINDLNTKIDELDLVKKNLDTINNALKQALEGNFDQNENISNEAKDLIKSYLNIKASSDKAHEQISSSNDDLKKINQYIEDFGLKDQEIPNVSKDYSEIVKSLSQSMKRIEENVHINMYKNISDALSNGKTDKVPSDLLDLIQHLIIDRLDEIVKPYEELSQEYVSGKITHKQFTDSISKSAFLSVLREKLISDVTREFENNNLSSPFIPPKLRSAAEKLKVDQSNSGESSTFQYNIKSETPKTTESNNEELSESISQSYSLD